MVLETFFLGTFYVGSLISGSCKKGLTRPECWGRQVRYRPIVQTSGRRPRKRIFPSQPKPQRRKDAVINESDNQMLTYLGTSVVCTYLVPYA